MVDPFWSDVINAVELIFNSPEQTIVIERNHKKAEIGYDGLSDKIVVYVSEVADNGIVAEQPATS